MSNSVEQLGDPVQWSTSQVLEWMDKFQDSKQEIKLKILCIVGENDLDGHALKQLRDDSEELHELLPVLKERLTFKAMMRYLLGSSGAKQSVQSPAQPSKSAGGQNSHALKAATDAPQSPTQTPSTSLESPPPPSPKTSPAPTVKNLPQNDQPHHSVLPAFSSFISSQSSPGPSSSPMYLPSEAVMTSQHPEDRKNTIDLNRSSQPDMFRPGAVYPTGLFAESYLSRIPTTQTPIFSGQIPLSPPISKTSNYGNQLIFSESRVATPQAGPVLSHTYPTDPASTASRAKCKSGPSWTPTRGMRYTKAQEITQKYKKILQRVRSTAERDREPIPFPAPLPTFSPILQQQIDRGNLLSFKTRFVYECAQFYMSINPTPTHTGYRNISMTIISKFRDLADVNNDREPWRPFNTSLSQAIRNIRRRLRSVPGTGFPPAAPRYQQVHGKVGRPHFNPATSSVNISIGTQQHHTHDSHGEVTKCIIVTDDVKGESSAQPPHDTDKPCHVDDDDIQEIQSVVIKTEDVPEDEGIIPEEWTNEKTEMTVMS